MRFEAKRKTLSEAVSRVVSLTTATGSNVDTIQLFATDKRLTVRTIAGAQVVESAVREFVIEEPGCVSVNMTKFAAAMAVSGDLFKFVGTNSEVSFACGRAKGRLPATPSFETGPVVIDPPPTLTVRGFKALLKATALKSASKDATPRDRTLHLEVDSVRMEATDTMRAIIATQALEGGDDAIIHSFNLPPKVLDELARVLEGDGDVQVGVGDRLFTLHAPGITLSIPRCSTAPLKLVDQLEVWLQSMPKHAQYTVTVGDLTSALKDALTLTTNEGKLAVVFAPGKCRIIGTGDSAQVEVEFESTTDATEAVTAHIEPLFLSECLRFYRAEDAITLDVFNQALVMNVKGESPLQSQMTALPFTEVVAKGEPKPPEAKKAKGAPKKKAAEKPAPVEAPVVEEETFDEEA